MENEMIQKEKVNFLPKFSYSKLGVYESCGWQYKLKYIEKHFIDSSSIANEFGTLVHFIEETIARDIMANDNEPIFMIEDQKYIDLFINADIHNENETILGVKKLKEKYPNDFYTPDKYGNNYNDKANDYLNYGIYRLRDYLAANRNLNLVGVEIPFDVNIRGYIFHGFIDRVLKDTKTNQLYIEDIKTWATIDGHDLVTPLQFVIYTMAANEMYKTDNILCAYDLPFAKQRYNAGTKNYITRGLKKINKLLDGIEAGDFAPNPTPLCHWCVFSKTYDNQPDEAKNLCPYYSLWTKEHKTFAKDFEWMGMENHAAIMEQFLKANNQKLPLKEMPDINKSASAESLIKSNTEANNNEILANKRIFILRR